MEKQVSHIYLNFKKPDIHYFFVFSDKVIID